jgi:hypothetical protein
MKLAVAGLVLICAASASAQKLDVKIVDRQDSATGYTYVVPAHFNSQSNSNVNCHGDVTCNESFTTTGSIAPPRRISDQAGGGNIHSAFTEWPYCGSQLQR